MDIIEAKVSKAHDQTTLFEPCSNELYEICRCVVFVSRESSIIWNVDLLSSLAYRHVDHHQVWDDFNTIKPYLSLWWNIMRWVTAPEIG